MFMTAEDQMTASHSSIHPSAIVERQAVIGAGVKIGPFCTVGPDVMLEDGVELVSHVVVSGRTRIGRDAKIFPFCTVGVAPQDLKYKGEETETSIGARTVIREHCSIHRGTVTGTGITKIGADCLLMAVVHVAHDCDIGDGVIVSNNVVMGGHVEIGSRAVVGGAAAILQFVRIGSGAMIGGLTGVSADVIPYGFLFGTRGRLGGLNMVGLSRRGLEKSQIHRIRAAYKFIFGGPGVFADRVKQAQADYGDDQYVAEILAFIANPGRHGLITTLARGGEDDA
jgi:UDP-N-acetylglucosamine acyltransferase